ncbi:hypothetical protein QFC20_004800 [Naganishia adeliensis]|uniref:Uncharacterized protein n=1 Tax=Naganishia adeliensis TaxID=92952 RepID=A0ACC2VW05_9TREE|nr:hypothetical protein QFC20_004800 [Naganishia adeliensis]
MTPEPPFPLQINLLTATIQELQSHLASGMITSVQLAQEYLKRIEANNYLGLKLRYERLYSELARDSDTGMRTTAGSYALINSVVPEDATVVAKLRAAGAIIIGKANLSEFANLKGEVPSGWSARGGQTQSAYIKGGYAAGGAPGGSSSGSAVGVSAGFAAAAVGTESDGSMLVPCARAGVYGLKATVGLISRTGMVAPIRTADTLGPITRSTYDAALLLGIMAGKDQKDLGKQAVEDAISKMKSLGAITEDPADFPSIQRWMAGNDAYQTVVKTEFKVEIERYLKTMISTDVKNLEDIIEFNNDHADIAFGPEGNERGQTHTVGLTSESYIEALRTRERIDREGGIARVLNDHNLDALVLPAFWIASAFPSLARVIIASRSSTGLVSRPGSDKHYANAMFSYRAAFEAKFPPRAVPTAPELAHAASYTAADR